MLLNVFNQICDFTSRYVLHRALPHGLVSWRYLHPDPPPLIRLHRQLWILQKPPRMPLAAFFFIEFILWLRWICWAGLRASWRAALAWGKTVNEHENISTASQIIRVLSISLGWCIPPAEIYAFGFFRKPRTDILQYVFTHELPAFHIWRDEKLSGKSTSRSCLQDKHKTAKLLAGKGIRVVEAAAMISRGAPFDMSACLQKHDKLFCKPRHGSRSLDAFVIARKDGDDQSALFHARNGIKEAPATPQDLQNAMMKDDFLIEPFLENHPSFAALTSAADAVTLRVITENSPQSGMVCYCATVEIPNDAENGVHFHIILPINLSSGKLERFPNQHLPSRISLVYESLYERMNGFVIPFWEEIHTNALAAHSAFPDVYAIAWDYIVTAQGPYLLEGNTGWGTRTPQILQGGLIKNM